MGYWIILTSNGAFPASFFTKNRLDISGDIPWTCLKISYDDYDDFQAKMHLYFHGNFVWISGELPRSFSRNNLTFFAKFSNFDSSRLVFFHELIWRFSLWNRAVAVFATIFTETSAIFVDLLLSFSQNDLTSATLPYSSCSCFASAEKSDNFWVCSNCLHFEWQIGS